MQSVSTSTLVFVVIGALILAAAVTLGMLGSFAYLAVAAVGMFFVAAALISNATRSRAARVPAFLALFGIVVSLVGTVTTIPFLLLGVGLTATAGAIVLLLAPLRDVVGAGVPRGRDHGLGASVGRGWPRAAAYMAMRRLRYQ